jgi:hypothetical protein
MTRTLSRTCRTRRFMIPVSFVPSEATFLNGDDRVIGLPSGKVAKASSAGILLQHGLVQDRSPDGLVGVTW